MTFNGHRDFMSRYRFLSVRILLTLLMPVVFSVASMAEEDPSRAADYDALRKLRFTFEDAVNSNDLAKLKPALATVSPA